MTAFLLSVHVLASILLIGPVTVAASLFPRYGREAVRSGPDAPGSLAVLRVLHRISRGYGLVAVLVPVVGVATAVSMGVLAQPWLMASIALTVLAALALGLLIVPGQRRVLHRLEGGSGDELAGGLRRLAMATGAFSLIWTVVVVLMILRPGSTTGV